MFRENTSILPCHRRKNVPDAKDTGQKDHNGGDPDVSFGISEDQQLWEIHDRQHPPEHFEFFLMAGRRGLCPEESNASDPQNQDETAGKGSDFRRGD